MKITTRKGLESLVFLWAMCCTVLVMGQAREVELNNGIIKLKIDLNSGGAISYLSDAKNSYNVINIYDKGRYVQQSYYAGRDLNRQAEGQHPGYSPWNWNPIQAGDVYGNRSEVITYRKTARELYVKNRPKLWDMNNEVCECYFETWITLEGNGAKVRNKLTSFRTDNRWGQRASHQELPAVYTVGALHKLYSYTGNSPWKNKPLSVIPKKGPPWRYWNTSEKWAALVNNNNWGLGVYTSISELFIGGFDGNRTSGGPRDYPTGYFSPLVTRTFGKKATFDYTYYLVLGNLNDIRSYIYQKRGVGGGTPNPGVLRSWEFNQAGNTQGWRRGGGTGSVVNTGGALKVNVVAGDPQIILSNLSLNPRSYATMKIGLKNYANDGNLELFWSNRSGGFSAGKRITVPVVFNSRQREYVLNLKNTPLWNNGGTINALRIDPPGNGSPSGEHVRIDYIRLTGANGSHREATVTDIAAEEGFSVFPNPFNAALRIRGKAQEVWLYNAMGQIVDVPISKAEDGFQLDTSLLTPGIYYLQSGGQKQMVYKK